jgi:hypothetical protein
MMNTLGWLLAIGLTASGSVANFDSASLGKLPPGWTVPASDRGSASRWEIRKDPSAPTQPYVLAQVANNPQDDSFSLAILNTVSVRDADVSVRLKPVSGEDGQGGGLVFRYKDDKNYYLVRADARQGAVGIYRVENGTAKPIHPQGVPPSVFSVKHHIPANNWSILKVAVRGNKFQVYVNHRRLLQANDSTFSGAGKVGLVAVADCVTYFDDFRVYKK